MADPSPKRKRPQVESETVRAQRPVVYSRAAATRVAEAELLNRRQATDYASKVGIDKVKKTLNDAREDLKDRTRKLHPALGDDTFTAMHLKATMIQIDIVVGNMKPDIASAVSESKQIAADRAQENSLKTLSAIDSRFEGLVRGMPLEVAMQFDPDAVGKNASILRRLMESPESDSVGNAIMERYGTAVVGAFEDKLRVGMVTGKSFAEMREDLIAESTWLQSQPMYWAQRIVRTEVMGAYSRAALENAKDANKILGDMVKILVAGFDDRTAWDSYQVHGQIRKLSEPFEWITRDGQRIAYMTPPNRPNDRETVIYHRVVMPIPDDLKPVSDAEYEAVFVKQCKSKKNKSPSPPARPRMTTVPLTWFGTGIPDDMQSDFEAASE